MSLLAFNKTTLPLTLAAGAPAVTLAAAPSAGAKGAANDVTAELAGLTPADYAALQVQNSPTFGGGPNTTVSDNPLTAVATTINVNSTIGFPTSGFLRVGGETVQYTGITATSFTGCTRGVNGSVATQHFGPGVVPVTQGAIISASSPLVAGRFRLSGLAGMNAGHLGQNVTIFNSLNRANDGVFQIVQVVDATTIEYLNPAGIAGDNGVMWYVEQQIYLQWSNGEAEFATDSLEVDAEDLFFYVDAVSGDDNNPGTATSPVKSLEQAATLYQQAPSHKRKSRIYARPNGSAPGVYSLTNRRHWDLSNLDGQKATPTIIVGGYVDSGLGVRTVSAVAGSGSSPRTIVDSAGGLVASAWIGEYCRFITGDLAGQRRQIRENTANSFEMAAMFGIGFGTGLAPSPGDQFVIEIEAANVSITVVPGAGGSFSAGPSFAGFGYYGVKFTTAVTIDRMAVAMSGCEVQGNVTVANGAQLNGGGNVPPLWDNDGFQNLIPDGTAVAQSRDLCGVFMNGSAYTSFAGRFQGNLVMLNARSSMSQGSVFAPNNLATKNTTLYFADGTVSQFPQLSQFYPARMNVQNTNASFGGVARGLMNFKKGASCIALSAIEFVSSTGHGIVVEEGALVPCGADIVMSAITQVGARVRQTATFNPLLLASGYSGAAAQFAAGAPAGQIRVTGLTVNGGAAASISAVVHNTQMTLTGLANMTSSHVGQFLVVSGAANAGNNGTFRISSFINAGSVNVLNPNAVAPDANNGAITWNVDVVGNVVDISGSANAANNGSYQVATYINTTTVDVFVPSTLIDAGPFVVPDAGPLTWTMWRAPRLDGGIANINAGGRRTGLAGEVLGNNFNVGDASDFASVAANIAQRGFSQALSDIVSAREFDSLST